MRPPKWSPGGNARDPRYLVGEADRSLALPDAPARLAYLQREAWNVADRVGGDLKIDAVNVALHIDQLPVGARPPQDPRRVAVADAAGPARPPDGGGACAPTARAFRAMFDGRPDDAREAPARGRGPASAPPEAAPPRSYEPWRPT